MYVVITKARSPDEALRLLEDHFLDDRAKRINDDVWLEISFPLFKLKIGSKNEEVKHEKVLNEFCSQILEHADIRTGSGYASDITAKMIAAVRGIKAFARSYRNCPRGLLVLNSAPRPCALKADRAALR